MLKQEKIVLIVSLIFLPFFVGDVLSSAIFLSIPTNLWFARWFVFLLVFLFLLCCFSVFLFGLLSFFYFFCMVRSARPGVTVFDARLGSGISVFSDKYLDDNGRLSRFVFFRMLLRFLSGFLGVVVLGFFIYVIHIAL